MWLLAFGLFNAFVLLWFWDILSLFSFRAFGVVVAKLDYWKKQPFKKNNSSTDTIGMP